MLTITLLGGFPTEDARGEAFAAGAERLLGQATQVVMPSDMDVMLHQPGGTSRHFWLVPPGPEHTRCVFLDEDGLHYGSFQITNPAAGVGVRLGTTTAAPLIGPFAEITIHYGMMVDLLPPTNPRAMTQFPRWWPRDHTGRLSSHTADWDDLTTILTGWPLPTTRLQLEPWPADDAQP